MKPSIFCSIFCVSFLFTTFTGTRLTASDLLIKNHSFEDGFQNWSLTTDGTCITLDSERSFTGTKSAKLGKSTNLTKPDLESDKLAASPGTTYIANGRVLLSNMAIARIYLRFWDDSGKLLTETCDHIRAETQNQQTSSAGWRLLQTKLTAPRRAATVSVKLSADAGNAGDIRWDDILITKEYTNLGIQVNGSTPHGTAFGTGSDQNKIYIAYNGADAVDASVAVLNINTETIEAAYPMRGSTGSRAAATATDGSVYFAGGRGSSPARVFRYNPDRRSVDDLGIPFRNQTLIWTLEAGANGEIFGGTYNRAGVFHWRRNRFTQTGNMPIWPQMMYARGLAYDASANVLYIGAGTLARLIRCDLNRGTMTDVLPEKYANVSMVNEMEYTGSRLFALCNDLLVLRIEEAKDRKVTVYLDAAFPSSTLPSPARDGQVYIVKSGELHCYDIAAKSLVPTGAKPAFRPLKMGWVTLANQDEFPGQTLVGFGKNDAGEIKLFKYNPDIKKFRMSDVSGSPRSPVSIHTIHAGPDGKIYSSGFADIGFGVYTPLRGDEDRNTPDEIHQGMHQCENMLTYNGKLYCGTYPGGKVYEYDPAQPWKSGKNPRLLFDMGVKNQDRPYGLAAGDGKIFAGTIAKYGLLQGALGVHDIGTGTTRIHFDIVKDQSVLTLAWCNGKVYGGTSIKGGLGGTPTQKQAKLFVYDPVADQKTAEYDLPRSGLTAITALLTDGNQIWGMAEGWLFIFDPLTEKFEYIEHLFHEIDYKGAGEWNDATLLSVAREPDYIFGSIGKKYLFKINKATKSVERIVSDGADSVTADDYGYLYYINGYHSTTISRYAY